jgi:hypothetical protein
MSDAAAMHAVEIGAMRLTTRSGWRKESTAVPRSPASMSPRPLTANRRLATSPVSNARLWARCTLRTRMRAPAARSAVITGARS